MARRKFREYVGMVAYPKGSIMYSTKATNPETYIGGKWILLTNTFLLAANSSYPVNETNKYNNVSDGGSANAVNVSHTHAATSHVHYPSAGSGYGFIAYQADTGVARTKSRPATGSSEMYTHLGKSGATSADASNLFYISNFASTSHTVSAPSGSVSGTGRNMPPYRAVYTWLRTEW
ncbi:MAG: hypothetical protein Q4B18_02610 [Bacillota bacterium]|nr:hypothetical protein [Bacillota bacterium]